jgi:hypothetical protein
MGSEEESMTSMPSFEESAKKFKPGPTAPPESEADRPDMSGGGQIARGPMPDGTPGESEKLPGE